VDENGVTRRVFGYNLGAGTAVSENEKLSDRATFIAQCGLSTVLHRQMALVVLACGKLLRHYQV
jgi:hypothetical protein